MEDCIFCKIVKGEVPADFVYKSDSVIAFKDIKPSAPVHVLIIPVKHIVNIAASEDADAQVLGEIQLVAKKIASEQGIADGFKLTTNNGAKADQAVMHLHYHLMGGWQEGQK